MTFSQNEFDAPYRPHVCFMYDSHIANLANETTTTNDGVLFLTPGQNWVYRYIVSMDYEM